MNILLFSFLTLLSFKTFASTQEKNLESLNFYPNSKAYLIGAYQNQTVEIDTPEREIQTKKVNNFSNLISIDYAYKVHPKFFLGISGTYESTSENALRYGIGLKNRYNNHGYHEPKLFVLTRLREQSEDKGLIDFYLSYSDTLGSRQSGPDTGMDKYNGRNILIAKISHGKKEDEWEFRSSFIFTFNGEGKEHNNYDNANYLIQASQNYEANFGVQYQLQDLWYLNGSIGVIYRGDENIRSKSSSDKRQVQAGTGSIFSGGAKYMLSPWTVLQAQLVFMRSEYFVKGSMSNLDGRLTIGQGILSILQAF